MKDLKTRINKRWNMTVSGIKSDLNFSPKLAIYRLCDDVLWRFGLKHLSEFFHNKKEAYILDYLYQITKEIICRYRNCEIKGVRGENAPIWVCWWNGLDTAPDIVKRCVKSIYMHSGKHPVFLITRETYNNYLQIPEYIIKKMEAGQIGLAHFSDYMRICLINKYGGLWLDATIYCADDIPEQFFDAPFFTCKSPYCESRFLSHYEWVTFVLGGWQGNVFYAFLKEAFEAYWFEAKSAIDYLFFDDLIYLAREHIPAIKHTMDALECNTPHRDELQAAFNAELPGDKFDDIISKDTPIYKLSWREHYREIVDGYQTVYGYFLHKN